MTSRRRGRAARLRTGLILAAVGACATVATASPAQALGDGAHGFGRMGPALVRTTSVTPSSGPDFEMPFVCGQSWTGTTRSSHSPSPWTIDWNTPDDLGKPALASAPGVVTKAVTLTGSYGRYVVVDHGGGWSTLYAHLNAIVATVGTVLDQGDLVGYVGGSGHVTGPHLHFEERYNGAYFHPYLHRALFAFGSTLASRNCTDRPVIGDWNGDGKADVGLFRAGSSSNTFFLRRPSGPSTQVVMGRPGDSAVAGDFDGDGTWQVGVRRLGSSTWNLRSASGSTATVSGVGGSNDDPVSGDWNGDHRAELGYYRPSTHTFYLRKPGGSGYTYSTVTWGASGDQPVTGDWNGDGTTDLGTFAPQTLTWTLRVPSGSTYTTRTFRYGVAGDSIPITGDWNGDGVTDVGVYRPSLSRFYERTTNHGVGPATFWTLTWGSPRG